MRYKTDWTGVRCQETFGFLRTVSQYIRCSKPAVMIVWHKKDEKAYPMCLECGDHNVRNRGGQFLGSLEPIE